MHIRLRIHHRQAFKPLTCCFNRSEMRYKSGARGRARDNRSAEGWCGYPLRGKLGQPIRASQFTTHEWGCPMKRIASILALAVVFGATSASAQTLKTVKDRGILNCGANGSLAGFGLPDAQGKWAGLDVDLCRAVAAAVFGDDKKVKFVPLSAKDRFTALQSGEVDVLAR